MPASGGLCPDSLPGATQGSSYVQDVTFYLPPQINVTSPINLGNVPLKSVYIRNITGLPFGLSWQANKPSKTYFPSNGENHGCVQICGTTYVAPGTYNLTVNVDAVVAAGGILGDQSGSQSFSFQMEVLPSSSANPVFNLTPTFSCGAVPMNFTSNMAVSYPNYIEYAWDFGDNTTSTNKDEVHTYATNGSYTVTNTTTIYQLAITYVEFTSNTDFHTCAGASTPKTKVKLTSGSASNSFTPTTGSKPFKYNVNWVLNGDPVSLWMEDEVAGIAVWCNNKTAVANITGITGPGTYSFSSGSYAISGHVVVSKINPSPFTATETVNVYSAPPSTNIISSLGTFDLCDGDSLDLSVYTGFSYRWYHNDTVELANSDTNVLRIFEGGRYRVDIADPVSGCVYTTPTITVNILAGVPSSFVINFNGTNLIPSISGPYSYQWQIQNGANWVNIPAPLGVQSLYTPQKNGVYRLVITSVGGCSVYADKVISTLSIVDDAVLANTTIFPNPSNGVFNVKLDLNADTDVEIFIYDISGRMLKALDKQKYTGSTIIEVNASDLNAGIYVVNTRLNGVDKNHRLVIQ